MVRDHDKELHHLGHVFTGLLITEGNRILPKNIVGGKEGMAHVAEIGRTENEFHG